MDVVLLHAAHHILEAGQRIRRNNERLKAHPEAEVPRDQGFTRPRVRSLASRGHGAHVVESVILKLIDACIR